MAQYETHEILAETSVDTTNEIDQEWLAEFKGWGKDSHEDIAMFLDDVLDKVMASDVEDAHYNTTDPDSFIHDYQKQHQPEER